jgi:type II secretory ATPase GspE/PulE/Tfp pilus assembly ATPase PilB-like protein
MQAVNLMEYLPLPQGDEQYSVEFIEKNKAIVLSQDNQLVKVGLVDGDSLTVLERLEHYHHLRQEQTEFLLIASNDLSEYLSGLLAKTEAQGDFALQDQNTIDELANDAPIVNLVNAVLMEALRLGASDIHVEGDKGAGRVRYRIDGVLQTARTIERGVFPLVSSRIKIMADLNILEQRLPQDGRLTAVIAGDAIDFRVSIIPAAEGESLVLRAFNKETKGLTLEELGFSQDFLSHLDHSGKAPNGVILVTGPTGSGKTTTLASLISRIQNESLKVITLEDPVENLLPGVIQVPINEAIGLTFDDMLRRVLRQDPDVILVGEIRDAQTAKLAIRAALTGHLVLATLHTNDALSAVHRMKDLGVENYLLSSVLRAVIAQRLVRVLCPQCKKPVQSPSAWLLNHGAQGGFEPVGCPACSNRGYKGRRAMGEIFPFSPQDEEFLLEEPSKAELQRYFHQKGFPTLFDDAIRLYNQGLTSEEELKRTVFGL